jgi:hypothetical protein
MSIGLVGIYIDEDDRIIATQFSFHLGEQRALCQGRFVWQADEAGIQIVLEDEDIPTVRQANVWSGLQANSKQAGSTLGHALRTVVRTLGKCSLYLRSSLAPNICSSQGTVPQPMHVGLVLPAAIEAPLRDSVVRTAQESLGSLSIHVLSVGPAAALSQGLPIPDARGPQSTLVLAASGSVSVLEGSRDGLPLRESRYVPPASAHTALVDLLASAQKIIQVLKLDEHMTLPVDEGFVPYVYNLTAADVARGGALAAGREANSMVFNTYARIAYPVSIVLGDAEHGLTHILLGPDDKAGAVRIVPATIQTRLRVQFVLGARPRPADNIPLGDIVLDLPRATDGTVPAGVSPEWSSPIVCATARWTGTGVYLLVQVIDAVQRRRTAVELPFGPPTKGLPREELIRLAEERHSEQERVSNAAVRFKDDDEMEREQRYQAMRQGQWSSEVGSPVDAFVCRRLTWIVGSSGSYSTRSWRGFTIQCTVLTAMMQENIKERTRLLIIAYKNMLRMPSFAIAIALCRDSRVPNAKYLKSTFEYVVVYHFAIHTNTIARRE